MNHWSGQDYDQVSEPVAAMVRPLVDNLELGGDEIVVDLGCGSGRVSELIAEKLPRGRLIAVDQNRSMLSVARERLSRFDNVEIIEADITTLDIGSQAADLVFSSAVFHWIKDHETLFDNIHSMLAADGRLVAQCGGQGNVATIIGAAEEVRGDSLYQSYFAFWCDPFYFAEPEATEELLLETGFSRADCSLVDWSVVPDNPEQYLSQVILGHYLTELPEKLKGQFIEDTLGLLARPLVVDYLRLNIDADR